MFSCKFCFSVAFMCDFGIRMCSVKHRPRDSLANFGSKSLSLFGWWQGGEGVQGKRWQTVTRGGGGVKNRDFYGDILFEWPLSNSLFCWIGSKGLTLARACIAVLSEHWLFPSLVQSPWHGQSSFWVAADLAVYEGGVPKGYHFRFPFQLFQNIRFPSIFLVDFLFRIGFSLFLYQCCCFSI